MVAVQTGVGEGRQRHPHGDQRDGEQPGFVVAEVEGRERHERRGAAQREALRGLAHGRDVYAARERLIRQRPDERRYGDVRERRQQREQRRVGEGHAQLLREVRREPR